MQPYTSRATPPATSACTSRRSHHSKQYGASVMLYWNQAVRTRLRGDDRKGGDEVESKRERPFARSVAFLSSSSSYLATFTGHPACASAFRRASRVAHMRSTSAACVEVEGGPAGAAGAGRSIWSNGVRARAQGGGDCRTMRAHVRGTRAANAGFVCGRVGSGVIPFGPRAGRVTGQGRLRESGSPSVCRWSVIWVTLSFSAREQTQSRTPRGHTTSPMVRGVRPIYLTSPSRNRVRAWVCVSVALLAPRGRNRAAFTSHSSSSPLTGSSRPGHARGRALL